MTTTFKEVLRATDLFVADQKYEHALIAAGLLKANNLKGGVRVIDGTKPATAFAPSKEERERRRRNGPRGRAFLVGFEGLDAHRIASFLEVLHDANYEVVGVYGHETETEWSTGFKLAGREYADWMVKPRTQPWRSLAERALDECRKGELLDSKHLSEALFLAAQAGDASASPLAALFANWKIDLWDQALAYTIHDLARARTSGDAERNMHARVATMLKEAREPFPGYFTTSLSPQALAWTESGGYDGAYFSGFLSDVEGRVILTIGYNLSLNEARQSGLAPQPSGPLAKYGFRDAPENTSDGSPASTHIAAHLYLPHSSERKKWGEDIEERLAAALAKSGIRVLKDESRMTCLPLVMALDSREPHTFADQVLGICRGILG